MLGLLESQRLASNDAGQSNCRNTGKLACFPLGTATPTIFFCKAMATTTVDLRRLDCTIPGKGPWRVVPDLAGRSINVQHRRSRFIHRVYYGTRTERTQEDAEIQATALCALLNVLKAKRP